MSGTYLLFQNPPLFFFSFDQRFCLDFAIPNLFNVKGKIGTYQNFDAKFVCKINQ